MREVAVKLYARLVAYSRAENEDCYIKNNIFTVAISDSSFKGLPLR